MMDRQSILSRSRASVRAVEIPAWGETLYVRELTVGERDAWDIGQEKLGGGKLNNFRSRFLALVLSDSEGKRIFSDAEAKELEQLPARIGELLFEAAARLNGFLPSDFEDAEKN